MEAFLAMDFLTGRFAPHEILGEVVIVSSMALFLGIIHVMLHNGLLAVIFGPELMKPLLDADSGNSKPTPKTASQEADAKNEDIKKWAHLAGSKGGNINVKLHTTVQDVIMSIVSIILLICYIIFMMDPNVNETTEAHINVNSPLSFFALRLHCGSTLYEILLYSHIGKDAIAYIHHFLVLANFSRALTRGKFHYYGAWLGTVEGTNPFLSGTFGMMRLGLVNSPWLTFYTAGLLISFFFLRVINLPTCFYTLIIDRPFIYRALPNESFLENDIFFFDCGLITVVILWILSVWWFSKMVKGVFKRMAKTKSSDKKTK